MSYNFDKIINRKNTKCYKWDSIKEFFGKDNVIPMWVADMDFSAPPEIIEVLKKRVEHGIFGYTAETRSYFDSIINWLKKRFDWNIEKDWIVNTPGIVPAINFAIQTFTNPKDKILVQTPVYFPFFTSIQNNGRTLVNSELILKDNHYEMDYIDLEKQFSEGVKMMIFCNPHNPVGRVWTKPELLRLGKLCLKYKVLLISDEIHADIIFHGHEHYQIANILDGMEDLVITMMAPSKTFNIAGLSTSYLIISNKSIRKQFNETMKISGIHLGNIFGIEALEAAYNFGEDWLVQLLIYLEANYDFVKKFLNEEIPKIKPVTMEGTYLLWLDCRKLQLTQKELINLFLHKAKIALNDGTQFGAGGEGFMRINIGCPRTILEKALSQIKEAVDSN